MTIARFCIMHRYVLTPRCSHLFSRPLMSPFLMRVFYMFLRFPWEPHISPRTHSLSVIKVSLRSLVFSVPPRVHSGTSCSLCRLRFFPLALHVPFATHISSGGSCSRCNLIFLLVHHIPFAIPPSCSLWYIMFPLVHHVPSDTSCSFWCHMFPLPLHVLLWCLIFLCHLIFFKVPMFLCHLMFPLIRYLPLVLYVPSANSCPSDTPFSPCRLMFPLVSVPPHVSLV